MYVIYVILCYKKAFTLLLGKQRRRFSNEEKEKLEDAFQYYITNKKTPPLSECRLYLNYQEHVDNTPKAVQDKVRNLIKFSVSDSSSK